jgi:hypothetical protein
MNIFFTKNFGTDFTSFVNLELTDSYTSTLNIGNFDVEEAWLKYSHSAAFTVKAGLLIPKFNNLNEIKNRTVLLPYILRPIVYETIYSNQLFSGDFVPQQANLQIYGDVNLGAENIRLNYAVYMGNLSSDNVVKNESPALGIGDDTTHYKMFGARLGFEAGDLSFGISGTYDRQNLYAYTIGYVPRMRFGAYVNYSVAGFELEAEYIRVYNKLSADDQATLRFIDFYNPYAPKGFNKYYYHVNLLYNFTDKLFAYAGYDYLTSEDNIYAVNGVKQPTFGGGYKVNDSIVLKAQYTNQDVISIKVRRIDYLLGASIYF